MAVRILVGDALARLRELPDESVHCCVTSPPYWGLRDYDAEGQMGLEPTLGEHIAAMVALFREVRRVLRRDGTLWLNYGDCYATSPNGRSAAATKAAGGDDRTFRDKPFSTVGPIYDPNRGQVPDSKAPRAYSHTGRIVAGGYLKPKDLCMVPNRLAIALQEDGWWVRGEIVWGKPNPMPESITDRPATAHEKVFLLTKAARYFYDPHGVRRPAPAESTVARLAQDVAGQAGSTRAHGGVRADRPMKALACGPKRDKQRGHGRRHDGFNDRWDAMGKDEQQANGRHLRNYEPAPLTVWRIATRPFKEAHFATFPPDLVLPCLLGGTSRRGVCPACGAPWVRRVVEGVTLGWDPACACDAGDPVPGTVLDPFGGSGTVGLVADALGQHAILIELNPDYAAMARRRLRRGLVVVEGDGGAGETAPEDMPLFGGGA